MPLSTSDTPSACFETSLPQDARRHAARIADTARVWEDRVPLLGAILTESRVRDMAEIGVWRGALSAALLRACRWIRTYHMIDPWRRLEDWNKPLSQAPDFEAVMAEALRSTSFAEGRRIIHRGTTTEVIDRIADASLDAVYVDGDHTLRGVMIDLIASYPKLRPGGLLLGDDLSRDPYQHGGGYEPTMVFPAALHAAEAWGDPVVILPDGQFAIVKSPDRAFEVIDTVGGHADTTLMHLLRLAEVARKR